ncbi:MAG: hypothetical protein M1814_003307 [Vezdaea aestivalis]|nr:MAG: hypothetical protein M1814_003307 [Vezdaea aestivalis]
MWATYSHPAATTNQRPTDNFPVLTPFDGRMLHFGQTGVPDFAPWAIPAKPFDVASEPANPQSFQTQPRIAENGALNELDSVNNMAESRSISVNSRPEGELSAFKQEVDQVSALQASVFDQSYNVPFDTRRRSISSVTHLSDVPSLEEYGGSSDFDATRNHTPLAEGLGQALAVPPYSSPRWQRPRASSLRKPSPSPRRFSRGASISSDNPRTHRNPAPSFASTPPSQTSPFVPPSQESAISRPGHFHSPATPLSLPVVTPPSFSAQRDSKPQPLVLPTTYEFGPQLSSAALFFSPDAMDHFQTTPPMTSMSLPSTLGDNYLQQQQQLQQPRQSVPSLPRDSPDIFASARLDHLSPPLADMLTTDPELRPREQEVRSDNDKYTPRWVRGHGQKREGWCGLCRPGKWLILKNSAYWYDKSFTHGICAGTGEVFGAPEGMRRSIDNHEIWEGYCGTCDQWISLINSKRSGTSWFRHVAKVERLDFKLAVATRRLVLSAHDKVVTVDVVDSTVRTLKSENGRWEFLGRCRQKSAIQVSGKVAREFSFSSSSLATSTTTALFT